MNVIENVFNCQHKKIVEPASLFLWYFYHKFLWLYLITKVKYFLRRKKSKQISVKTFHVNVEVSTMRNMVDLLHSFHLLMGYTKKNVIYVNKCKGFGQKISSDFFFICWCVVIGAFDKNSRTCQRITIYLPKAIRKCRETQKHKLTFSYTFCKVY